MYFISPRTTPHSSQNHPCSSQDNPTFLPEPPTFLPESPTFLPEQPYVPPRTTYAPPRTAYFPPRTTYVPPRTILRSSQNNRTFLQEQPYVPPRIVSVPLRTTLCSSQNHPNNKSKLRTGGKNHSGKYDRDTSNVRTKCLDTSQRCSCKDAVHEVSAFSYADTAISNHVYRISRPQTDKIISNVDNEGRPVWSPKHWS